MKKIKVTIQLWLLANALLFTTSCKKALDDTGRYDIIGEDVVWANRANAETFIFSTYAAIMPSFQGGPQSDPYTINTLGFDDIYNGAQSVFREVTDRNTDKGFNNWANIRRCNLVITKVAASTGITDGDKKQLIAEGKFLRALSYYNVARNIGRIVWIDKVLTPDDELLLPSTASPSASYAYIIKDLEDAVKDLPDSKVIDRANKYTAAAFLSEVCLQALAYKNYPDPPNVSASDPLLQEAITNAQLVISAGYALEPEYGQMFTNEKPRSNETILGVYRKSVNTTVDATPMQLYVPNLNNTKITNSGGSPLLKSLTNLLVCWVQHGPTQNFADDYLVIDKNDPSKALPWYQTSQYINAVDETATVPAGKIPVAGGESSIKRGMIRAGSSETMWTLNNTNRDARWYSSVVSDSTTLYGETLTTCVNGNATRWMKINYSSIAYYESLSNMYWRKGIYTNVPQLLVGTPTDYHYVITRLGRVYMNLAEAYLLKGDVSNAVAALNMTRTIHGKLPPSTATGLTNAWSDYKRERRVELVLENDYYWSLLRWGRYGGDANHGNAPGGVIPELTEVPRVMDISKDRMYYSIVQGPFFSANNVRNFDKNRRYLFPIAQSYIDQNPRFGPQNPGW